MKKLLSKRSGFTVAEILVAVAVFAIMSAMICQMLSLAISRRRSNSEYADRVAGEKQQLAMNDKVTYDETSGSNGSITLNFGDKGSVTVDYQVVAADGTIGDNSGLNYIVGNVEEPETTGGTGGGGSSTPTTDDPDINTNTGTQMSRFNTKITGTIGLSYVAIYDVTKTKDNLGRTCYMFTVAADGSKVNSDDKSHSQFRFYFTDDSGNPLKVAAYGYVNNYTPEWNENCSPTKRDNNINKLCIDGGGNSVRLGIPYKDSNLSSLDASSATTFYVSFAKDPWADKTTDEIMMSFGDGAQKVTENGKTFVKYTTFVYKGTAYTNIYGAYVKS